MTHDELTALAERVTHPPYGRYDEQAEKLTQGYLALSVKLEEAHADRDAANQAATRIAREAAMAPGAKPYPSCHTLLLVRGEIAQPEVIKACPECGNNTDQRSLSGYVARGAKAWWCDACDNEYDEPAYYQRVPRPQE